MNTGLIALLSIVMSVAAQFLLRAGVTGMRSRETFAASWWLTDLLFPLKEPLVLAGLLVYGLGAILWLAVLSEWEVSKAYPLVGLGFALTAGIGIALGEAVGLQRAFGVALIGIGVLVIGRS